MVDVTDRALEVDQRREVHGTRPAMTSYLRSDLWLWLAPPIVMLALAAYGTYAALGLVADGSYFLVTILGDGDFFFYDPARVMAVTLTQAPVVIAGKLGVSDVSALIRIYSASLVGLPVLAWVGALSNLWRTRLYWAFVVMFAVTFLNGGLIPIGEFNLAYALVALSAAILLRRDSLGFGRLLMLSLVSIALLRSYEALVYLGPVLFAIAFVRLIGWRGTAREVGLARQLVLAGVMFMYSSATALSAWAILFPRDPTNAAGASDLLWPVMHDPQMTISVAVGVGCLLVPLVRAPRFRWASAAVVGLVALFLLRSSIWAPPWMQYASRTVVGLTFFVLLATCSAAVIVGRSRPEDAARSLGGSNATWFAPALLFAAQAVVFASQAHGFAEWASTFEHVVTASRGPVVLSESGLDPVETSRFGWPWTNPLMSILLADEPGQGLVLNPPGNVPSTLEEVTAYVPTLDPRFSKDAPLFP